MQDTATAEWRYAPPRSLHQTSNRTYTLSLVENSELEALGAVTRAASEPGAGGAKKEVRDHHRRGFSTKNRPAKTPCVKGETERRTPSSLCPNASDKPRNSRSRDMEYTQAADGPLNTPTHTFHSPDPAAAATSALLLKKGRRTAHIPSSICLRRC